MLYFGSTPRATAPATLGLVLAAGLASGCMSDKKKIKKQVDEAVEKCRNADSTFYDLQVVNEQTEPVLAQTCHEEVGEIEKLDEYEAKVDVGPYTWTIGLSTETNTWEIQNASWEALTTARTRLQRGEDDLNSLRATADRLGTAQDEYSDSPWIRLTRLDVLLSARKEARTQDDIDPLELGDAARSQLESTVEWARNNDDPETAARARLRTLEYLQDYIDVLERNRESAASTNSEVRYEKLLEDAEESGDDEAAEDYRKELEEIREQRPEKIAKYEKKLDEARTVLCDRLDPLSADGVEDKQVQQKIESTKNSIDCQALLSDDGESDDNDGSNQDRDTE